LHEAVSMNKKLAEAGLTKKLCAGFGSACSEFEGDSAYIKAKALAAAASDARMAGENLPAMSCATSGNVGITASIPLIVVAEEYGKSEEELSRALALSFLLTIYVKNHIGRLSAICACATAASVGIAAGTAFLLGGSYEK
jgi:L-cysteine desulfidase